MAKRFKRRQPTPDDWHLWSEVKRSVRPLSASLSRSRLGSEPEPGGQGEFEAVVAPDPSQGGRRSKVAPPTPTRGSYSPKIARVPANPTRGVIEPRVRRRLSRGQLPIDATIDLHGMRQSEAHAALNRFILARHHRGDRTVLVITGKGLKKNRLWCHRATRCVAGHAAAMVGRTGPRPVGGGVDTVRPDPWRRRCVLCAPAARLQVTPLGAKIRALRAARGVTLKQMAETLEVSSAYLAALEHGRRGTPTWVMLQRIIGYFNVIWDEAEELQRLAELSDPKITLDTAGLPPEATELTNRLAAEIHQLEPEDMIHLKNEIMRCATRQR